MGRLNAKMQKEGLAPEEEKTLEDLRAVISKKIMDSDLTDLFEFKEPLGPVPKKARILASMICENCGERVMETRTRRFREKTLCIPCFKDLESRM